MNPTAVVIAISYATVVVVSSVIFFLVWRSTRQAQQIDADRLARQETAWLAIVVVGLVVLLFGTIFFTPYGESAPAGSQVVEVDARQFAFLVNPVQIRAGEPVEFRLTASDVNHGFGVYTGDDELVLQAQIVPDAETTVVHTFDEPGTYKIVCLEYCGVDHHKMISQFEVVAG